MELTQLRYFMAVAESLHMTASAERLHVAQPALSQAIARLERELGVSLFERAGRKLALTPCGAFLHERLRVPLDTLEELPREIAALARVEDKTVRLNVLAASKPVTDAIIAYQATHPDVRFRLLQRSNAEECDISVSSEPFTQTVKKEAAVVLEERIFLAVPCEGGYGGRTEVLLAEVAEEGFISLAGSRQFRGICDKFCMQAGFTPHIAFESDDPASVRGLIAAHAGIGFWPEFSFGSCEDAGVRLLTIREPHCSRKLVLHRHGEKARSSEVESFFCFLCDFLSDAQARARAEMQK